MSSDTVGTNAELSSDEAQSWASLVALDAVDPEDQPTVDACRQAFPQFDRWVGEFADDAAELSLTVQAPAPPELRAAVLSAVANQGSGSGSVVGSDQVGHAGAAATTGATGAATSTDTGATGTPNSNRPGSPRRGFIIFSAAAVAVITLVISFVALPFGGDGTGGSPGEQQVAQAVTEKAEVAGGTVQLKYVPGSSTGTLTLNSVPAPAPGTAYQMWVRKDEQPAQSVGVMETEDVTPEMQAEVPDLEGAKEFMISLEPAGGSDTPSETTLVDFSLEG